MPEVLDASFRCLRPTKLPVAVEAEYPVALLLAIGNEVCPCRLAIDLQHVVVLPVVVLAIGESTHHHRKGYEVQYRLFHVSPYL